MAASRTSNRILVEEASGEEKTQKSDANLSANRTFLLSLSRSNAIKHRHRGSCAGTAVAEDMPT